MPGPITDTSVYIRPFGNGKYFSGQRRAVNAMVELLPEITEGFVDVLSSEKAPWSSSDSPWHIAIEPIVDRVERRLTEMQDSGEIELRCRKNVSRNCGARVGHIIAGTFQPDANTTINGVTIHLGCEDALVRTVPSNQASAAGESVDGAPYGMHLDAGCHTQLGVIAEHAGRLMAEELAALELDLPE